MKPNSAPKTLPASTPHLLAVLFAVAALLGWWAASGRAEPAKGESAPASTPKSVRARENLPATIEEARGRARWLHESTHGTLQVIHRDFFDDMSFIPSASLESVFKEMARTWSVEMRWIGVNATKDVDNEPRDRFERRAAEALAEGKKEYEAVLENQFRFVGAVRLQNECLKCHVPDRTSLEDRVAGLAINIPLKSSGE